MSSFRSLFSGTKSKPSQQTSGHARTTSSAYTKSNTTHTTKSNGHGKYQIPVVNAKNLKKNQENSESNQKANAKNVSKFQPKEESVHLCNKESKKPPRKEAKDVKAVKLEKWKFRNDSSQIRDLICYGKNNTKSDQSNKKGSSIKISQPLNPFRTPKPVINVTNVKYGNNKRSLYKTLDKHHTRAKSGKKQQSRYEECKYRRSSVRKILKSFSKRLPDAKLNGAGHSRILKKVDKALSPIRRKQKSVQQWRMSFRKTKPFEEFNPMITKKLFYRDIPKSNANPNFVRRKPETGCKKRLARPCTLRHESLMKKAQKVLSKSKTKSNRKVKSIGGTVTGSLCTSCRGKLNETRMFRSDNNSISACHCKPCHEEIPSVNRNITFYNDQGDCAAKNIGAINNRYYDHRPNNFHNQNRLFSKLSPHSLIKFINDQYHYSGSDISNPTFGDGQQCGTHISHKTESGITDRGRGTWTDEFLRYTSVQQKIAPTTMNFQDTYRHNLFGKYNSSYDPMTFTDTSGLTLRSKKSTVFPSISSSRLSPNDTTRHQQGTETIQSY
ncbi:hypothetical protein M8J76_011607 [Diaphorina citri]|nr:hypothetical protein M8J75_008745 [Diaphorina citri]KAI5741227.1 hypothetical protein M8J76_011607 [Diaphorina citri]KAI5746781.1 hypothetical protein M8J77_007381 [Diaphorina citri]